MFTQQEEPTVLLRNLYETYRTCSNIPLTYTYRNIPNCSQDMQKRSHLSVPAETSLLAHRTCRNNHTYLTCRHIPTHSAELQKHLIYQTCSNVPNRSPDLQNQHTYLYLQKCPQPLTRPAEPYLHPQMHKPIIYSENHLYLQRYTLAMCNQFHTHCSNMPQHSNQSSIGNRCSNEAKEHSLQHLSLKHHLRLGVRFICTALTLTHLHFTCPTLKNCKI